ncbi:hypothetical protein GW17_00050513, partial [Ensete ventricosum]
IDIKRCYSDPTGGALEDLVGSKSDGIQRQTLGRTCVGGSCIKRRSHTEAAVSSGDYTRRQPRAAKVVQAMASRASGRSSHTSRSGGHRTGRRWRLPSGDDGYRREG